MSGRVELLPLSVLPVLVNNLNFLWEDVDGLIGSRANDTTSYLGASTAVTLTVIDKFGCTDTDNVNVFVAQPVKAVVADTVTAAGCDAIMLDGTESRGSQLSFSWLPLNGTVTEPLFATTHYTANNGGESEVVLTVTDQYGCSDDDTVIVVSNFVQVDAGADETLVSGVAATLVGTVDGSGSNYAYNWSPEELVSVPSNISTTSVGLTSTTIFTLAVEDQDNGCNASDRKWANVTGGEINVAITGHEVAVCSGETVVLDAVVNGGAGSYQYTWKDESDVTIGTEKSLVVNPMDTIEISLVVVDGSAAANTSVKINVKASTIGRFELLGGGNFCVADEIPDVTLSGSEKDVYYILLSSGLPIDTVSGDGDPIVWKELANGDYQVMAYKAGECLTPMSGIVSVAFIAIDKLDVELKATNNGIYCIGSGNDMVLWLDTTSTSVRYDLLLNNSVVNSQLGNGDSLSWIALSDGRYTIKSTVINAGECVQVSADEMRVQGYGSPALENDTAYIPEGASISQVRLDVLYGTGRYSYKWMPADRFESDTVAQPVLLNYTSGETFSVELIDLLSGCSSIETFTVVTTKPLVYVGVAVLDNEICKGEAAQFKVETEFGDQNNLSFVWRSNGREVIVDDASYSPIPTINTTYTLMEVSDGYSTITPEDVFEVVINPSGLIYERTVQYCKGGGELTITPEWENKVNDWNWYDANNNQLPMLRSLSLVVDTVSEFIAVGANEFGCLDSAKYLIVPIEEPVAIRDTFYVNKSDIAQGSVEITRSIYMGDNDIINEDYFYALASPTKSFADIELYSAAEGVVNYIITKDHFSFAGKDSFTYIIKSDVCEEVVREGRVVVIHANKQDIFAPVGFSPNGDGINDFLEFEGLENKTSYQLHIFNRWGAKVFETEAPNQIWDGKANVSSLVTIGEDLPDGTYYYIIEVEGESKITGFVELMR